MNPLLREVLVTRWQHRLFILLCALLATAFALLAPFLQKDFIDSLTGQPHMLKFALFTPLQTIGAAFLCIVISQIFQQLAVYIGSREAIIMQKIFAKKIYNKTLNLRVDTLSHRPMGEIVALYATDVQGATVFLDQTLPAGASTLFPLILGPLAISYFFDIPMLPTVMAMVAIILLNSYMALRQSRFFFNFKQLAAERLGLVSEWVQNIRTIRILGWTEQFEKEIFEKREVETINRVKMVTNGQVMNAISSSITFALNVITLSSLVYFRRQEITSGELMALLWIVGVFLIRPFRQMPWFFTFAFDAWTSLKRLSDYLETPGETTDRRIKEALLSQEDISKGNCALYVKNLNLKIGAKTILKDIDLKVDEGEFVAIVGEVGSGKSMLLLSLLGETGAQMDEYWVHSKNLLTQSTSDWKKNFAFVPQEGFIMSASLRENVAFVYDITPDVDSQVEESLKLAQFDLSTERVERGLETEIGERGVNLSGGQRQRVSLARVHFHQAPILLLDDCLSAVDVDTEEKLLNELVDGEWENRTRLLVTHRLSVLPRVDRIIYLQEGHIQGIGTFAELLASSQSFRDFTTSVAQETQRTEKQELL